MTSSPSRHLDDALIGTCRVAALVDTDARIVRWCTPRFDSDPLFPRVLAGDEEKGSCDVALADQAWDPGRGALTGALDQPELDSSKLMTLPELGFIAATDDFGLPETAFLVCNFWYVDALHQVGRREEARERSTDILSHRNRFGILSEDLDAATDELWGNVPQTYSMAGIINSAMRLSRSWEEAWCLDL